MYRLLDQVAPLNPRLAEYVFFPLSHVFRHLESLSPAALSISLQCLEKLVLSWARPLDVTLAKQLLTLLCRTLARVPESPDHECVCSILECIDALFRAAQDFDQSVETAVNAQIGQVLDSALTFLATISTPGVQSAASSCILTIVERLGSRQSLFNFLPGIVSRLTAILSSPRVAQKPLNTLVRSLEVLRILLRNANPIKSDGVLPSHQSAADQATASTYASKIQVALRKLSRLQSHSKDEVVDALFKLFLEVLEDRSDVLTDTRDVTMDTAIYICGRKDCASSQRWKMDLHRLFARKRQLIASLAGRARVYVSHLPTLLLSASVTTRDQAVAQISIAHNFLLQFGCDDLNEFEQTLAKALLHALENNLPSLELQTTEIFDATDLDTRTVNEVSSGPFDLFLFRHSNGSLFSQIRTVLVSRTGLKIHNVLGSVFEETSASVSHRQRIVAFWFSSRSLEYIIDQRALEHGSHDLTDTDSSKFSQLCFEQAMEVLLTNEAGSHDWRLEGLALELVAFHAQQLQEQFRPELSDILFPIVMRMASDNSLLQQHAAKCLRIVSTSCGYSGPADAVLSNADYLVNAIALQLNTFDLCPEGLQILAVLLRHSGQRLVPYLEDVVDSVSSILSSFHGYSHLVEQVLVVLGAIADHTALESSAEADFQNGDCCALGRSTSTDADSVVHNDFKESNTDASRILLDAKPSFKDHAKLLHPPEAESLSNLWSAHPRPGAKSPTTYRIVKSISQVAKHFLSHESFRVRCRVLHLLQSASTTLCQDQDEFWPIIHEIWPGIASRLDDSVHVVTMAAIQLVATLARFAGDFLSSRVKNHWPRLVEISRAALCQQTLAKQNEWTRPAPAQMQFGQACVVELLLTLSRCVKLSPQMENDLSDLLTPLVASRPDVLNALQNLKTHTGHHIPESPRSQG